MVSPVRIVCKIRLQEIGKEKDFQDNKQDKKLDQDNQPNLFSPTGKVRKSIKVKPEGTSKYIHTFGNKRFK
jgi:hypothetical protein